MPADCEVAQILQGLPLPTASAYLYLRLGLHSWEARARSWSTFSPTTTALIAPNR